MCIRDRADSNSVRQFYHKHYTPSSAILSVAGTAKPDDVFRMAEKWFGDIPSSEQITRVLPEEPPQKEHRKITVYRDVPAAQLIMAFHTGGRESRDFYILDLMTDILSGCDSGRFPSLLVRKKELFSDADIYLSGEIDPGLVIFSGRLKSGTDIKKAEAAVMHELNILASEPVTAAELEKARNRYESLRHQSEGFIAVPCFFKLSGSYRLGCQYVQLMHYCCFGLFNVSSAFQPAAEDNQSRVNLTGEVDVSITEQLFFSHQQAWKTTRVAT